MVLLLIALQVFLTVLTVVWVSPTNAVYTTVMRKTEYDYRHRNKVWVVSYSLGQSGLGSDGVDTGLINTPQNLKGFLL